MLSVKEMFEKETGLKLIQDETFCDPEYGHYRYIVDSDSFLRTLGLVEVFNKNHYRYIKPEIRNNQIILYL